MHEDQIADQLNAEIPALIERGDAGLLKKPRYVPQAEVVALSSAHEPLQIFTVAPRPIGGHSGRLAPSLGQRASDRFRPHVSRPWKYYIGEPLPDGNQVEIISPQ